MVPLRISIHLLFQPVSSPLLLFYNTHLQTVHQIHCRKAHCRIILLSRISYQKTVFPVKFLAFIQIHHNEIFNNFISPLGCYYFLLACFAIFQLFRRCTNPLVHVITVPPQIWRRKTKNNYAPIIYHGVDDDLYVLKTYGKSMI